MFPKFIEFSYFIDDYVAIDMAKVRKFEDGLKLSIRGKIVGLVQDLDFIVKIVMAIERERGGQRTKHLGGGVKDKRKASQPFSYSLGKK